MLLLAKRRSQSSLPRTLKPPASPPAPSPKADRATGTESARGNARAGQPSAQARGGAGSARGRQSEAYAGVPEAARSASLPSLASSQPEPGPGTSSGSTPDPHGHPHAEGQRPTVSAQLQAGSGLSDPALRVGGGWGGKEVPLKRFLLLTASKVASRFSEAGRDAGALPGCEDKAAGFSPFPLTNLPNAQKESWPLRAARAFWGWGRARGPPAGSEAGGRTCPSSSPCDVTRVFLGVHAPSSRLPGRWRPSGLPRRSGFCAGARRGGC